MIQEWPSAPYTTHFPGFAVFNPIDLAPGPFFTYGGITYPSSGGQEPPGLLFGNGCRFDRRAQPLFVVDPMTGDLPGHEVAGAEGKRDVFDSSEPSGTLGPQLPKGSLAALVGP